MKYWTITFPGDFDQLVVETWSEDQIIQAYYNYWAQKMILNGYRDKVSRELCIDDWKVVHWAEQTDENGNKL